MEKQASKTKKNIIFKLFSKHPSFLLRRKSPHTSLNTNKSSCKKKTSNNKNDKKQKITTNNKQPSDKHSQTLTSPKISCIEQLLLRKNNNNNNNNNKTTTTMTKKPKTERLVYSRVRTVQRLYSTGVSNGRNTYVVSRIPNSAEIRRLSSRHETFKKFDRRVCYEDLGKDDDDDDGGGGGGEEEEEEQIVIDVSSINLGGEGVSLEPRKEINLWNRRTKLPPPPPLQLI